MPFEDNALFISPATSALVFNEEHATTSEHILSFVVESANDNTNGHFYLYCLENNSYLKIIPREGNVGQPMWAGKDILHGYWSLSNNTWKYIYTGSPQNTYSLSYDDINEFHFSSKSNATSNCTWVVKRSTTYQRPITSQWGTICLPHAIDMSQVSDAAFYGIMGQETINNETNLILDELTSVAAGQPCFVYTPSGITTLTIPLIGDIVTTPTTNNNGLIGTFQEISQKEKNKLVDKYILSTGTLSRCGTNCGLHAYRAYVDMSKVQKITNEQISTSAPVRLPLASAYTTPTGNSSPNTVHGIKPTKYLHNGHIVLSNGQQRFTILGQPL